MTVPSTTTKSGPYNGNDVATVFAYAFNIDVDTNLEVVLTVTATGVETVQTLTTHYTVSGVGDAGGGDVTMLTPPATGETVTIRRVPALTQLVDLQNQGGMFPETLEKAYDKLTKIAQYLDELFTRSLRLQVSDGSGADPEVPPLEANNVLTAAADGLSFVWATAASLGAAILSDLAPLVGAAAADPGTSGEISRTDHVHPMHSAVAETMTNKTLDDLTNFIHADGEHLLCRNVSGGPLAKGTPVYISGWNAGQGAIEIEAADADVVGQTPAIGILDEEILDNANGKVVVSGTISGLNTVAYAVAASLYVSTDVGLLTDTRPTGADANIQAIAKVLRADNPNGVILVQGAGRVNDVPNRITMNAQDQWRKGADVVSAAALPVLPDGNSFDVTGATSITSIDTTGQIGTVIKLHFNAALTLTHHATDLILPGAANITTAAGDEFEFTEYAVGDWRCTGYALASGEAIVGAAATAISSIRVYADNGHGSTNTKIRRWTTVNINVGSDITYADSATDGGSFTINTDGVYAISYIDNFTSATHMGITLNDTAMTTNMSSLTDPTEVLGSLTTGSGNDRAWCSVTLKLVDGDIIRAHTDGTAAGANPVGQAFTIARVA